MRLGLAALALGAAGLWWGGLRLHELDRSFLAARIGQPAGAQVVVTGAASRSPFAVRVAGRGAALRRRRRCGSESCWSCRPDARLLRVRCSSSERARSPREGPRPASTSEAGSQRRGIHVVLHASGSWQIVGRRGGIGGVGDRLRTAIATRSPSARRASGGHSSSGSCSAPTRESTRSSATHSRRRASTTCSPSPGRTSSSSASVSSGSPTSSGSAGRRSLPRDRRDPRVRPRGRLAALRRARGGGGLPRVGGVAPLASERSLAHDGRRRRRPPRLDTAITARARLPALVRGRRGDLPGHAAPAALARGISGAALARRGRRHLGRLRARDRADPLAPVRHDPSLDGAGERPCRAGDAGAARARARGGASSRRSFRPPRSRSRGSRASPLRGSRSRRVSSPRSRMPRRRLGLSSSRSPARSRRRRRSPGAAALPAPSGGDHRGRARSARMRSAGGLSIHRRRGRHRPASGSRSSTSARATGSSSRRRREQCWSTPARPKRGSIVSLRRMGLRTLAALVVTHAHRDHVGGGAGRAPPARVGR